MKNRIISVIAYLILAISALVMARTLYLSYTDFRLGDKMVFDSYKDFMIYYEAWGKNPYAGEVIKSNRNTIKSAAVRPMAVVYFQEYNILLILIKHSNHFLAGLLSILLSVQIIKLNRIFQSKKFFTEDTVKIFNTLGKYMLILGILGIALMPMFYKLFVDNFNNAFMINETKMYLHNDYVLNITGLTGILFGFIFYLIAYGFNEALKLKQENDLTV